MLCARCKVTIAYAPFDGSLPSYLVAVYRVGEASAVHVFVSPRKSCNGTMEAAVVAGAPPVTLGASWERASGYQDGHWRYAV